MRRRRAGRLREDRAQVGRSTRADTSMAESRITRRTAIGVGAAAGAGAVLPTAAGAAARRRGKRKRIEADVAIVGAGFAGLTAALEVKRAGHSAVILEARDWIGGRVYNHELPGGDASETGGHFARPPPDPIPSA